MYTCGTSLQDLKLDPPLDEVYIPDITCADHIEKLYYSAGYEPICIYCACVVDKVDSDFFPQCCNCSQPTGDRIALEMYVLYAFFCILCVYYSSFYIQ